MISLNRAVTFSEMHYISIGICQNLKFDMSRLLHKMFNIHGIIAKCHLAFLLCGLKALRELFFGICHTHAFSTSAEGSFYNNRVTNFPCKQKSGMHITDWLLTSWNDRNTCCFHRISCFLFIAKLCNDICRRSDKGNSALLTQFCKFTVL